jgi:polyisoprenoid-binding protein YceI
MPKPHEEHDPPPEEPKMTTRTTQMACLTAIALALTISSAAQAQAIPRASSRAPETGTKWIIDPVHSQIDFRVRHLVGSVRGTFIDWYGVIVTRDQDWTHGTVNVSAQTASLNTGNAYRDADLRSRFFAVDSFPSLSFESTGIVATDSTVEIGGILTIKGHARRVVLKGEFRGIAKDHDGHERIAFEASTHVNRRDFGMALTDFVGADTAIGDDVEITIAIEAMRTT